MLIIYSQCSCNLMLLIVFLINCFSRGIVFSEYYYTHLHPFMTALSDPNSSLTSSHIIHIPGHVISKALVADSDCKLERTFLEFSRLAEGLGIPASDDGLLALSKLDDDEFRLDEGRIVSIETKSDESSGL